jgi:alpha-mannosidase
MDTVKEAYALNDPLIFYARQNNIQYAKRNINRKPGMLKGLPPLATINCENLIIETVKRSENGYGIILRLYEYQRKRGEFLLKTSFSIKKAFRTNILEENLEEIFVEGQEIRYQYMPYQIITLRLIPDGEIVT